jgi:putative redox protein
MREVNVTWLQNMAFEAHHEGHTLILDAAEEVGGENGGCRPKDLLLSGLAGCTGMDVVSILKKMKIADFELNIKVTADSTTEHPKIFKDIVIAYEFTGKDLPWDKLERAVELSETRYCGVSAMLREAVSISSKITANGENR